MFELNFLVIEFYAQHWMNSLFVCYLGLWDKYVSFAIPLKFRDTFIQFIWARPDACMWCNWQIGKPTCRHGKKNFDPLVSFKFILWRPPSPTATVSDGHRLRRPPSLTANVCNSQWLSILCSQQFVVNSLPSIVCCRLYAVDYLPSIVCRQFFVIVLMLIVYSVPFILSSISSPK